MRRFAAVLLRVVLPMVEREQSASEEREMAELAISLRQLLHLLRCLHHFVALRPSRH